MALYCIGSYFLVATFSSVFIWSALVASKKDDISRDIDLIENSTLYELDFFQEVVGLLYRYPQTGSRKK